MNTIKRIFIMSICLINAHYLSAQLRGIPHPETGIVKCLTAELEQQKRIENPQLGSIEDFEIWLQEHMARTPQHLSREILTIPTIVHIVHNGEEIGSGRNISYEQVLSQIEVLNEDFRRMEGTNGFNEDSVGADAEIEFCLAMIGADGKIMREEPGVRRINRNDIDSSGTSPFSVVNITTNIKPATIWDPYQYFNIWVLDLNDNEAVGFANFPLQSTLLGLVSPFPATDSTDGAVVDYRFFGRVGNLANGHKLGRSLTHEVGHWLGLRHIWGDGDCSFDDFCDDTPSANQAHFGCPSSTSSCDSEDMVENYMDYSDDDCMNIFTLCQKNRMRTVMLNSPRRKELLNSIVCGVPTIAPIAAFSYGEINCEGEIQFFDNSEEIPVQWIWTFSNGETSEGRNPIVKFDSTGTYTVTLEVSNEFGSSQITQLVEINLLDGTVDAGEDINACQGEEVELNAATSVENGSIQWFPSTGILDPESLNTTLLVENVGQYILNITLENGCVIRDTLSIRVSPNPTTLILPTTDVTIEKGQNVALNAIGAETYSWSPEEGLSDSSIPNPVASPEGTTTYTVTGFNKDSCSSTDEITVHVNFPDAIDDGIWTGVGEVYPLFPNPASFQFYLSAKFSLRGKLEVNLLDVNGRKITELYSDQINTGNFNYEWKRETQIAAGFYLVEWKLEGRRFMQKIQVY